MMMSLVSGVDNSDAPIAADDEHPPRVTAKLGIQSLKGCIPKLNKPVSIQEMNAAVRRCVVRKVLYAES